MDFALLSFLTNIKIKWRTLWYSEETIKERSPAFLFGTMKLPQLPIKLSKQNIFSLEIRFYSASVEIDHVSVTYMQNRHHGETQKNFM